MFHRVKSEGQDTPSNPTRETEEAGNNAARYQPASAASQKSDTQSTPAEDLYDMSDNNNTQDEDNKTEAKAAPAAPAASAFSYQRAPAAAPAYPGSAGYAAAGNYGAQATREQRAPAASGSDRRLTIGAGITMSGEIESCDYLLVEGTVEAALKGANVLDIAESGTFYGTVEIDEANIAGRFEGDITVHGRLTISTTGTVTGSIAYKELEIEAGAVIDGKLTPLSAASGAKKEAPSKAKAAAPAKAKQTEVKQEAANNEGGLFSKAAAE